MIRHALAEGWLLLRSRGLISPVLAMALAIPISLAGVTLSVRQWLAPAIELGERDAWDGDDDQRPLSDRGRRQAEALATTLAPYHMTRVVSSPDRCEWW